MMTKMFLVLVCMSLASRVYTAESQIKVFASPGLNAILPCRINSTDTFSFGGLSNRIKWTKLENGKEIDVLVSMGSHKVTYGRFDNHVHLLQADENDASLIIPNINQEDFGKYRCEIYNDMDDVIVEIDLNMNGVVFPYSPRLGRYNLNFHDAKLACVDQGAEVASFEQLYQAWQGGLDWCNAGWLSDGTVQYPITKPRLPCGGNLGAGLRSYGRQNKTNSRFDVFCFTANNDGSVFFVDHKLTYPEAVQACEDAGADLAKVAQIFAAWKLQGYDRCDAGWLADGSVRYPISRPRMKCSPTEAAVRSIGFPDKKHKLYGAYCYSNQ